MRVHFPSVSHVLEVVTTPLCTNIEYQKCITFTILLLGAFSTKLLGCLKLYVGLRDSLPTVIGAPYCTTATTLSPTDSVLGLPVPPHFFPAAIFGARIIAGIPTLWLRTLHCCLLHRWLRYKTSLEVSPKPRISIIEDPITIYQTIQPTYTIST
jgi:hypothetical protein